MEAKCLVACRELTNRKGLSVQREEVSLFLVRGNFVRGKGWKSTSFLDYLLQFPELPALSFLAQ